MSEVYQQAITIARGHRLNDTVRVVAEVGNRIAVHRALLYGEPRQEQAGDHAAAIWTVTHVPSSLAIRTAAHPLMFKRTADALAAELRALPQGPEWESFNPVDPRVIAQIRPIADRYAAIAQREWEDLQLGKWRLARQGRIYQFRVLRDVLERAVSALEDHREDEHFRDFVDELAEWVDCHGDEIPSFPEPTFTRDHADLLEGGAS